MKKPTRVLCKRTLTSGDNYQVIFFSVISYDNRMLVEGEWYDVIYNKHDEEETFTISNHQGKPELFYMYDGDDTENYPRSYSKWFYTEKELRKQKLNKLNYENN